MSMMDIPSLGLLNASVSQDMNSSQDELREGEKANNFLNIRVRNKLSGPKLVWILSLVPICHHEPV